MLSSLLTTINFSERAFTIDELSSEVKKYSNNVTTIENRYEAYEYTKRIANEEDLVVWCGSLYLIRDLLGYLKTKE